MPSDPQRTLKTLGRDLATIPLARLRDKAERVGFICINSFKSYRLNLGTGPINDAVSMAHCLKSFNFDVYFISSPHCKDFLKYLDAFFRNTTGQLVFFYVGHGLSLRDIDIDETDGNDEAFVFDDGVILDDDLVTHVIENKNPSNELILITDACRPGTIWTCRTEWSEGGSCRPECSRSRPSPTRRSHGRQRWTRASSPKI